MKGFVGVVAKGRDTTELRKGGLLNYYLDDDRIKIYTSVFLAHG